MNRKKSGLQSDPLDRMFEPTKKKNNPNKGNASHKLQNSQTHKLKETQTSDMPKYKQLDERLNVLISGEQTKILTSFVKQTMSAREKEFKEERITKNTVIRALVDLLPFLLVKVDAINVSNEAILLERLKTAVVATKPDGKDPL